ncbi:uncharacterized protein LOC128230787 isoform X2 [Mya arenaria]|uniref:uncharacterized protein LOC128230787 isoform X2 n=1 Tax=Mya arenaria TaxID=6604 RepID=UPI0022E38D4A|nr:uncharacterized protein LOC128230787 isoform X2 [Mya arenaria]
MMLMLVCVFVLLGVQGLQGQDVADTALTRLCRNKCRTELCYLADETDCRRFIMCEEVAPGNQYTATVMQCAYGTFWAGLQVERTISCDSPKNVNCSINYCQGRNEGEKFDLQDSNCKIYWECSSGVLTPSCCGELRKFDPKAKACVADLTCYDQCPIKKDVCLPNGPATEPLDDANCRTYWNCGDKNPLPVCCESGMGYDPETAECKANGCTDICPPQYEKDICKKGVQKYDIQDNHCRTYMQCNAELGDERWCCPSGRKFDSGTEGCVPLEEADKCNDYCPPGYKEFCPLEPVPTNSSKYITVDGKIKTVMDCAPGSLFDIKTCTCAERVDVPDNSCNMELDIVFDDGKMVRSGAQKKTQIIQYGQLENGTEPVNNRLPFVLNGKANFEVPFAQQQYDNVFISVYFKPANNANEGRQVLVSNCMNLDLGAPTLDLSLLNGNVQLQVVTIDGAGQSDVIQLPFQVNVWQEARVLYTNGTLQLGVQTNTGSGKGLAGMPLTGGVTVAGKGLEFCGCGQIGNEEITENGFVGLLAELKFSKCVKQLWVDEFVETFGSA